MTDAAPTDEPDAIAHMTDVELETFARAVVAERDALAAALESARADNETLRAELEMVGQTTLGTALVLASEALAELDDAQAERDAARAELAAERAQVQAVGALIRRARFDPGPAGVRHPETGAPFVYTDDLRAALAAAQPTGKTP